MTIVNVLENLRCPICNKPTSTHPLYAEDVAKTCINHGDFFAQHLQGRAPTVVFRAFEEPPAPTKPQKLSTSRWKNNGIAVRCEQTGMVYRSIKRAALDMGINEEWLSRHLSGMITHAKGYTFVKMEDVDPDEVFVKKPRLSFGGGLPKIIVRCNETGQIFESVRQASRETNVSLVYLRKHLKDPVRHKAVKGFTYSIM